jgi:hypothetical protein
MLNFIRSFFKKSNQDLSSDEYWEEADGTKVIYQREGRHFHWDGKEEKEISLKMNDEKK